MNTEIQLKELELAKRRKKIISWFLKPSGNNNLRMCLFAMGA